jgi:hypothetical protein
VEKLMKLVTFKLVPDHFVNLPFCQTHRWQTAASKVNKNYKKYEKAPAPPPPPPPPHQLFNLKGPHIKILEYLIIIYSEKIYIFYFFLSFTPIKVILSIKNKMQCDMRKNIWEFFLSNKQGM